MRTVQKKKKKASSATPKSEVTGSSNAPKPKPKLKFKSRRAAHRDETPRERLEQRYADVCVPFPQAPPLTEDDDMRAFAPLNTDEIKAVLSPLSTGPACALLFNSGTMSPARIAELHAAAEGVASSYSAPTQRSIEYGPGALDSSARHTAQPDLANKLHALLAAWAKSLHRPSHDLARWDHATLPSMRRHAGKLYELLAQRAKGAAKKEWFRGIFPWATGATLAGLGTVLSLSWGDEAGWQRGEKHHDGHYTAITITGGTADLYVTGVNHRVRLTHGDVVVLHPASEYAYMVVWIGESEGPRFVYTCYTDKASPQTVRQWEVLRKEARAMVRALEGVGLGEGEGVEGGDGEDGGEGGEDVTM
ncbi:uncharacterized protein LOC62_02G003277 [Vanrija pseudolonga]|uniref:Uncharacterized protein n=1 Tax=Vanrija pseudolonga TaxID=143232 RepID=A0AAF0Y3Z0_9TREE|nr:hypothetical protein LOC62_02G003277 [Vanrija pseudolonga]